MKKKSTVIGGRTGYANVFKSGSFAWENKAPGKNLINALRQLQNYSLALNNPPILVVCDRLTTRIYTQFNGHPTETFDVLLAELDQPDKLARLRRIWQDRRVFAPKKPAVTSPKQPPKALPRWPTACAETTKRPLQLGMPPAPASSSNSSSSSSSNPMQTTWPTS